MKNRTMKNGVMKCGTGMFALALFVSSAAIAGNLSGLPNTFLANKTATASEVNANFEAARVEIDDNANNVSGNTNNISNNATAIVSKQTRVTGSCSAGQTISQINTDGTVVCEAGGAGSGLNADTLDGNNSSDFTASGQTCSSGNVTGIDSSGNVICASGVSFSAVLDVDITVADSTEVRLTGFTEYYDDGNNFDPLTGVYTIPSDGVYQFIVNVNVGATTTLNDVLVLVRLKRNFFIFQQVFQRVQLGSYTANVIVTGIVKATAGDAVTFNAFYSSGGTQIDINGGGSSAVTNVAGFKIY